MPAPQAPQGAPSPQGGQDPDQAQGGQPPQGQGGGMSGLMDSLGQGLVHVSQFLSQSKAVDPQGAQMIMKSAELYQMGMQKIMGGSDDGSDVASQSKAPGQSVPMEAGGNKGAMPSQF